eukprot:TRINITY_DN1106_c0_g1_i10.p4 TRINITY_DN1106_c0_g1~~TRINITY_DN1106_c0_g1_i10.p4  ORF type:complete len:143 (-),score=11.88 TRINITY_DN1106_c0_g1_i10:224-652(-)
MGVKCILKIPCIESGKKQLHKKYLLRKMMEEWCVKLNGFFPNVEEQCFMLLQYKGQNQLVNISKNCKFDQMYHGCNESVKNILNIIIKRRAWWTPHFSLAIQEIGLSLAQATLVDKVQLLEDSQVNERGCSEQQQQQLNSFV